MLDLRQHDGPILSQQWLNVSCACWAGLDWYVYLSDDSSCHITDPGGNQQFTGAFLIILVTSMDTAQPRPIIMYHLPISKAWLLEATGLVLSMAT